MIAVVVLGGAGLVAFPGLVRRAGRRLPPRDWCRLAAASLLTGAVLSAAGLAVMALPTILGLIHGSALAQACARVLGPLAPRGGPVVGPSATVLLAWAVVGSVMARRAVGRAQRSGRIEASFGDHRAFPDSGELVLLPCDQPVALSVPGQPAQVVVSQGLAATLPPAQFAAVVAHERSHLSHHHHRLLLLATVVARGLAFVPGARRSVSALRVALERWADEDAAGLGDRRSVSEALVRVSYLQTSGVAAFGAVSTILERLEALDEAPVTRSWRDAAPLYTGALSLVVTSLAALASQTPQLRAVADLVGRCLY